MDLTRADWGRKYCKANEFLNYSADFYISARKLLTFETMSAVMPGLVCGSYAIEQLIKAGLYYLDKNEVVKTSGSKGHVITNMARTWNEPIATQYNDDLELFETYFLARYPDNPIPPTGLHSAHFKNLDSIYQAFYAMLNVPIPYHWRVGILANALGERSPSTDYTALAHENAHLSYYQELFAQSRNE
jgi:hypothetical protein